MPQYFARRTPTTFYGSAEDITLFFLLYMSLLEFPCFYKKKISFKYVELIQLMYY